MAFAGFFRVMVSAYSYILVFAIFTSLATAAICPNNQYLNSKLQRCVNCTECNNDTVVLKPCEIHKDTYCAPISELLKTVEAGNPHRHKHKYHQRREHNEDIVWRYGNDIKNGNAEERHQQPSAMEVASSEAPFSSAETLVWDWQAVALTSAVLACILFFLIITLYSFHQARQWRRLKENFDADVEELSAKLSLMAAASCEKGEFLDSSGIGAMSENYLNSRCVYLEQLLSVRTDGNKTGTLPKGNVYIEETNSKT